MHTLHSRLDATRRLIVEAADRDVPALLIVVPDYKKKKGLAKWRSKLSLSNKLRVQAVCEAALAGLPGPCSCTHEGYILKQPKDFVKKAAGALKWALVALRIALAAGRVVGLPLPSLPSDIQVDVAGVLDSVQAFYHEHGDRPFHDASECLDALAKGDKIDVNPVDVDAVRSVLGHTDWAKDHCGLVRVVLEGHDACARQTLWVCQNHKTFGQCG